MEWLFLALWLMSMAVNCFLLGALGRTAQDATSWKSTADYWQRRAQAREWPWPPDVRQAEWPQQEKLN